MSSDQPFSNKRQRLDAPFILLPLPSTTTTPSTTTPAPLPLSSATASSSRPIVQRGRPPLSRSAAESQAAATRHTCPTCGKTLQNAYKLDRHTRTHSGDLPFTCAVCGKRFSDQHNARRHQRTCVQRRGMEQAMQSVKLSWPLWREQPDDDDEEGWQQSTAADGVIGTETNGGKRKERGAEDDVEVLPRLNRWLFPRSVHNNKANDAVS